MGALLVYIIKSTLCLAMFYLFYRLLLNGDTFHRLNRVMLLGIIVLSAVIPFIHFSTSASVIFQQPMRNIEYLLMMASLQNAAEAESSHLSLYVTFIFAFYICGCLFFSFRFFYSFRKIIELIHGGEKHYIKNGVYLVVVSQDVAPFSWMKYIVISKADLEESGKAIWLHERAHIVAGHSVDMLLMSLFSIIHWFNPAVWLLKEDLQSVHEYEADEQVINHGINIKQYQLLLIKKAVGSQRFTSMANSFNHSKLKNRITMMLKSKSNSYSRLKYLYVLPLSALAVVAFARPEISQQFEKISSVKVIESSAVVQTNRAEKVQTPSKALSEVVVVNPVSPKKEVVLKPETRSASTSNVLEKKDKALYFIDGVETTSERVNSMDPSMIESVTVIKNKEALEKYGEKGKNGVILVITKQSAKSSVPGATVDSKETPIYMVNGKEVSKSEVDAIDPSRIESMSVLKVKKTDGNKKEVHPVVVIKLKNN